MSVQRARSDLGVGWFTSVGEKDFWTVYNYIDQNPVAAGLVQKPLEFPLGQTSVLPLPPRLSSISQNQRRFLPQADLIQQECR
jgi:hypothetical protein